MGLFNCTTNIDYLGTLTGRIGFTFDQFLIYGKGGAAVQRAHFGMISLPRDGIPNVFGGAATQWGWEQAAASSSPSVQHCQLSPNTISSISAAAASRWLIRME